MTNNMNKIPGWLMVMLVLILGSAISVKRFPKVNANMPPEQVAHKQATNTKKATTEAEADYLFAVGDTGSGTPNQVAVARAMTHQAKLYTGENPLGGQVRIKGILHLGDIIYPIGAADKVDQLVHQMYAPLTQMNIPFYFSLGNHDMITNRGQDVSMALNLPTASYYQVPISKRLDAFAINTSTFVADTTQQAWLKQAISKSSARWQLVFGHHPLYSTGAHGHDADLVQLRKVLEPILINQGVEVYLAGHDHNYERFSQDFNRTDRTLPYLHIVSGGGGAYLRNKRAMPAAVANFPATEHYNHTLYHFLDVQVTDCELHVQARDVHGASFDSVAVKHPVCL